MTVPAQAPIRFSVVFSSTDDLSGVRDYDVQYKVGATGPWTAWLTDTTVVEAPFVGTSGYSYTSLAEVKATDNVNNTNPDWIEAGPVEIASVTKYYLHGGTRVAMRQGEEVYYLHGDHLGSTSLTTDASGAVVSEVRYHPYGQERWANGEAVTDFEFTSQRKEGFNLHDYNARYYSSVLGRFISPDTIVPEPGSSGGFNRYRYTRNNPLRYTDPSGHAACVDNECKHLVSPKDGELIGNKEFVKSLSGNEEYVYRKPPPPSDFKKKAALYFQAVGTGADAAATITSGIGATLEIGGALAGGIPSDGIGAIPGFLAGYGAYNSLGLNFASDVFGMTSTLATYVTDTALSNSYLVYDQELNTHVMVMGSGSQYSTVTAGLGLASPEAISDYVIDSAGFINSLYSSVQMVDSLTEGPSISERTGIPFPDTSPADRALPDSRRIVLPQFLNGVIRRYSNNVVPQ